MKLTKVICIIMLVMLAAGLQAQVKNFHYSGIAVAEGSKAIYSNPAGIGINNMGEFIFTVGGKDSDDTGEEVYVGGIMGLGFLGSFAFERNMIEDSKYIGSWRTGSSLHESKEFSIGYAFGKRVSNVEGVDESYHAMIGAMYRPCRYISLAAVYDDFDSNRDIMNTGESFTQTPFTLGAAFRLPIGSHSEAFTLFGDFSVDEDFTIDDEDKTYYKVGAKIVPADGFAFNMSYDKDENIWAGMSVSMDNFGWEASSYAMKDADDEYQPEVYFTSETSVLWNRSIFSTDAGIAKLTIKGSIEIEDDDETLFSGASYKSIDWYLDAIKTAEEASDVTALLIRLEGYSLSFAGVEELRQAVSKFKSSGKEVYFYAHSYNDKDLYLASVGDYLFVAPTGGVEFDGLAATITVGGGFFDLLGIDWEYARREEYKSFVELFAADTASAEYQEQMNDLLDGIVDEIVTGIADARYDGDKDKVLEIMNEGPYMVDQAKEIGLIDEIVYYDKITDFLEEKAEEAGEDDAEYAISSKKLIGRKYKETRWGQPPVIAVVNASGAIMTGVSGYNPLPIFGGKVMGDETMIEALTDAQKTGAKVIVMRVDSPGGSALASDNVLGKIRELKEDDIKVIVSMQGVAGSGGYYIACLADRIYVDRTTITGSIGVGGTKMVSKKLMEEYLRFNNTTLKRGKYSTMFGSLEYHTEEEKVKFDSMVGWYYDRFLGLVAEGRGSTVEEIRQYAKGRIWMGNQAVENGLADEVGTFRDALDYAIEEAGVGDFYEVKQFPKHFAFSDIFTGGEVTLDMFRFPSLDLQLPEQGVYYQTRIPKFE